MKTLHITILIMILILIFPKETEAQTLQTKLNQVELMKRFIGNWEWNLNQNTTYQLESRSFGNGITCNIQVLVGGEIIDSVKQLSC